MILKKEHKINIAPIEKMAMKKNKYKNFCMFMIGMLICSISINLFYIPNDIVTTGSTGLAILVNRCINIDIPLLVLLFSSMLTVFDFILMGVKHGSKYLLATILYPIFLKAGSLLVGVITFNNTSLFLLILIGAVIYGFGFGIIRRSGYNLGGLNIIYDLLHRRVKISIGTANFICNIIIVAFSLFIFGLDKCIYAGIALYIFSVVADKIMLGISRNKAFYIITKKPMEVKQYIINNMGHTVTIVNAKGGYSDRKKKMLLCVIPTTTYCKIKDVIREIDDKAFFLITDTYSMSK